MSYEILQFAPSVDANFQYRTAATDADALKGAEKYIAQLGDSGFYLLVERDGNGTMREVGTLRAMKMVTVTVESAARLPERAK